MANELLHELDDLVARMRPPLERRSHMCHPEKRAVPELRGYGVGDALIKVRNVLVENGRVVQAANVEPELTVHNLEARNSEPAMDIG